MTPVESQRKDDAYEPSALKRNGERGRIRTNTSRLSIAGSTFELILPGAPFGS